ncbi:fungal specific transcription factor domain-containing protein [Lasallia pustulata]|uniref:Fungal specific transcription factor domain-containing protein n=1 Tax=Lasallia pustulata TaxID=136370 RepID=A0A1W5CWX5_9LECA|nr:fungal specific transcription factor domain-containing protein [Lasallia pustulata]
MDHNAASLQRPRGFRPYGESGPGGQESHEPSVSKVAHTLTACCRCRQRKTRCDAGLPRCGPCERSNTDCEYFDTAKGTKISRSYVIHLQDRVRALEAELGRLTQEDDEPQDAEVMVRGAGLVRFTENDDSRFLGPSSGIAMTRLVMELAKQNTGTKSIKEVVPDTKARQIKDRFTNESSKPTSKVYPLISNVAAEKLPTPDLMERLVENFHQKAQYMLPTLHEPSFRRVVKDVYAGSLDPYNNFAVRMVVAVSMQKLDIKWAGLADSYYLAALPYLEAAIRPMNLQTLQCFALIAQYSLVTSTRTASYWVVGMASRLCQQLGITSEATIAHSESGVRLSPLEVDMRRRLFWIITSMELGLAHSLGRPSAFGTTPDHINVGFFEAVDDRYITPDGVTPGSPSSIKKLIAIHFFKMRLLQAEIRRQLYLKKRPEPDNDQHPWFEAMEAKLERWRQSSPNNDEGSGLSQIWFNGRYNTMIVFLYRPSPQVPEPSLRAAQKCFEASRFNIYMQRKQIRTKSVDLTWVFTQSLFMALNTVLWTLSYPDIRKEHPRMEVETHLNTVLEAIFLASERWPGVESALELYDDLVKACLKAYDGNSETSYVVSSPSNRPAPASPSEVTTPPPLSSPAMALKSLSPTHSGQDKSPSFGFVIDNPQNPQSHKQTVQAGSAPLIPDDRQTFTTAPQRHGIHQQHFHHPTAAYEDTSFDPNSVYNTLPSSIPGLQHWITSNAIPMAATSQTIPFSMAEEQNYNLALMGNQYSQYLQAPYEPQQPVRTLNHEEQIELMNTLEMDGLQDLEDLMDQSARFFSSPGSTG